jgi:hypothetical protein
MSELEDSAREAAEALTALGDYVRAHHGDDTELLDLLTAYCRDQKRNAEDIDVVLRAHIAAHHEAGSAAPSAAALAAAVLGGGSASMRLYRAARAANNVEALVSGNPERMARRARNVLLGRALSRAGFWRFLWGGGRR